MANEIEDLIAEIQFKSKPKLSVGKIAERIGYSREHLTVEKKKGDNKDIVTLLKAEFKDILQSEVNSNSVSLGALYQLIDANQKLADGVKNTSEANLKLTVMLERATADDPHSIPEAFDSKFSDLLELIAEVASGEMKYRSKQEASASLSKRFHGIAQKT